MQQNQVHFFLKKDFEVVTETLSENMKKLPILVDKLSKTYCRMEVYFVVDSPQKLGVIKERMIKKIESLKYVQVPTGIVQDYFKNYIIKLNEMLVHISSSIDCLLFIMVLYWDLITTLSSDTRISNKSLSEQSASVLDLSCLDFDNLCFKEEFYELFNISKFNQILVKIFSDGKKQKEIILYFLSQFYAKYKFKTTSTEKITLSKNIIGQYVKKFIEKYTYPVDPSNNEIKEVDLKEFVQKLRSKTRVAIRKAIASFIIDNLPQSPFFFAEIVKDRVIKANGVYYKYSSTPYVGELRGQFEYILAYSNSLNYDDAKLENEDSDQFFNIKKYFLAYLGTFIKKYEFKGGFLEGSLRELLLRLMFFETDYQNALYRGPNLFLRIFIEPQTAAKYYFNYMALNYCIIVAKSMTEKGLGRTLYRFKDNFFRTVRREDSNIETSHYFKGLYIYSFQRKNLLFNDKWDNFKTSIRVKKIEVVKEDEENCCGTVSESDQLESTPTSSDLESEYSLHDTESSEDDDIHGRIVKKNFSRKIKESFGLRVENIVLGVYFEPFIFDHKLNDLEIKKIETITKDCWMWDCAINLWGEIVRVKYPEVYIFDTCVPGMYMANGIDAVKHWLSKVTIYTNRRLKFYLPKN